MLPPSAFHPLVAFLLPLAFDSVGPLLALPANSFVIALFVGLALVGLAMLWYGGRDVLLAYRVLTTDPTDAMSLGDGDVAEVEGVARVEEETTTAPFTGTECLAFEYEVLEEKNSGKNTHWETVDSGQYWVPFRVEDDTASALVDPRSADLRLGLAERIRVRGGERPPERIQRFIDVNDDVDSEERSIDLKVFELNTGNDRKYVERRLDPGESVHVLGEARYDASAGRDAGDVNIVLGASDRTRFVVSDSGERGAAWRVAKSGLPFVLTGLVLLLVPAFLLL